MTYLNLISLTNMKLKISIYTVIFYLFANHANAYLDPGTGSILLQALIAAIAAVGAFFTFYWRKLKDFINKIFNNKNKNKN